MIIRGKVIKKAKNMMIDLKIMLFTFLNPIFASILVVGEFSDYPFTYKVNDNRYKK